MLRDGGAGEMVEADVQLVKKFLDLLVVLVHVLLVRDARFLGVDGDGHAVLVGAADVQHVLAVLAQEAAVDIRGQVGPGYWPKCMGPLA